MDELQAGVEFAFAVLPGSSLLLQAGEGVDNGRVRMVAQYSWILRKRALIFLILLRLPRALLAGIVATRGGSMISGTQVTVFYDLAVRLKDDSDVSIGDGFRGYGEAQRAGETIVGFTRMPFLGELSANSGFAARKAAYLAKRDKR